MKKIFNIVNADWGIGDIICSLYAIQALANKKPECEIRFFLRQYFQWAELADIPNMSLYKYSDEMFVPNTIKLFDRQQDPYRYIKHTNSPKHYCATRLGVSPAIPKIQKKIIESQSLFDTPYILLAPFASQINRTWEVHNWRILGKLLADSGFKVIALGSPSDKDACQSINVEFYCGQTAEWTAKVCYHAEMIIGNDSGLAHLGGWFGVKTLVLMSQLLPNQFYALTNNKFIVPQQSCTGCRFIPDYGYEEKCNHGCWVLQSIRPLQVFETAMIWLSQTNRVSMAQMVVNR